MNKIIGYVLSAVGVVLLLFTLKPIKSSITTMIPFVQNVPDYVIIGAGLILMIFGVFIVNQFSGPKQPVEVPIYQGKNVVGFRRMGKK